MLVTKIDNNGANVWSTKIGDAHKTANQKSYSIGFAIDQVNISEYICYYPKHMLQTYLRTAIL